jgi:hypothetical protein
MSTEAGDIRHMAAFLSGFADTGAGLRIHPAGASSGFIHGSPQGSINQFPVPTSAAPGTPPASRPNGRQSPANEVAGSSDRHNTGTTGIAVFLQGQTTTVLAVMAPGAGALADSAPPAPGVIGVRLLDAPVRRTDCPRALTLDAVFKLP